MQHIIEDCFDEVHRSNMSKLDDDGKPIKNGYNGVLDTRFPKGKILKSETYSKANLLTIVKRIFRVGDLVKVINIAPLKGKEVAPPLEMNVPKVVVGITLDSEGNQHIDVGIKSELSFVTSFETGEELPDGHKIHWCHPSRFARV